MTTAGYGEVTRTKELGEESTFSAKSLSGDCCPAIFCNPCLKAALDYAELGWRVFQVRAEMKRPCVIGWQKTATTDQGQIRGLWDKFPDARVGILLGKASRIIVLDIDLPYGYDSFDELQAEVGRIVPAVQAFTQSGGQHLYFKYPPDCNIRTMHSLNGFPDIEILSDRSFVLAPPSQGEKGQYEWEATSSPFDCDPGEIPAGLMEFIFEQQKRSNTAGQRSTPVKIPEGIRNVSLTSMAGALLRKGMARTTISAALQAENCLKCDPPLSRLEVEDIAKSVSQYNPEDPAVEVSQVKRAWHPPEAQICSLNDVQDAANELMPGCDLVALRAIIGAYFANIINEARVWLLVVGGSSSGKSEILISLEGLPLVKVTDNLTRPAMISGTSRSQMQSGDPGGLLFEIGNKGILVIPDMSSILSMSSRQMNESVSILRRIYDGSFSYQPGTGGTARFWHGRLGLIAAVTGVIDFRFSFMSDLGTRFLIIRERTDPLAVFSSAEIIPTEHRRRELAENLRQAVRGLAAGFNKPDELPDITENESSVIRAAAMLTAMARSPVIRNKKGTPLIAPPGEHPHRVRGELTALYRAFLLLGCSVEEGLSDVVRVAVDTISPPIRSDILMLLHESEPLTTYNIARIISTAETTAGDTLKTLQMLRLVHASERDGSSLWMLTDIAVRILERLSTCLPKETT